MLPTIDKLIPFAALLLILAAAVWTDLRHHRIPNLVTFGGVLVGICLQGWTHGTSGLMAGAGGMCVGLAFFLPFYLRKGMGAGDVKLMAAVGTFLGPINVILAAGLTLGVGGAMAILILISRNGLAPALSRYWATMRCLAMTHQWAHIPPAENEVAATRFPYAAAIATGTGLAIWWLNSSSRLTAFQVI